MSNGTSLLSQDEHTSHHHHHQNNDTPHQLPQNHDKPTQNTLQTTSSPPQPQPQHPTTLQQTCADIHARVSAFLATPPTDQTTRNTQEQTKIAMQVIDQALVDYNFESLSISYNGGKDCLVLLVLYLAVIHTHFTQPNGRRKTETETETSETEGGFPSSVQSIYAKPPDPFDSVTEFVESSTRDYHLDLTHISTNPGSGSGSRAKEKSQSQSTATATATQPLTNGDVKIPPSAQTQPTNPVDQDPNTQPIVSFRDAFALYLHRHPKIKAIFVGTRRTDPHGAKLQHFQMTDGNWPRFIRIHPVIDWRLSEIWCFLRSEYLADPRTGKRLEYCGMYDAGYTSLGGVGDTLRNPRLRYYDEQGKEKYKPAYEMTEDEEERAGRE